MQELIDKVEHAISYNVEGGLVEKYTWEELFNDMYVLLEKEKEQIIDAFIQGGEQWNSQDASVIYYNQTYNQTNNL